MPERDGFANGTPAWVDLASADVDQARGFYETVFGWGYTENPTDQPEYSYYIAELGGRRTAGMMQLRPEMAEAGMPPVWSTYVSVDDADATVAKVVEAGGTVLSPVMAVMDTGRMAVFSDPTGAVVGIWEPGTHKGAELVNEHGALVWNELITADVDGAAAFYAAVFGWERHDMDMGENGTYTTFSLGGPENMIAGAMNPPMPEIPPHWALYFQVDDLEAVAQDATAAGANILNPPMKMAGVGTMALLSDPGGAVFALMQPEVQPD